MRELFLAEHERRSPRLLGHLRPKRNEPVLSDATRVGDVAVDVGEALPGANRREVRRPQSGGLPLTDREIRNSVEADFPRRPWLRADPFDDVGVVLSFFVRKEGTGPARGSEAAQIQVDDGVSARNPMAWIWRFPARVCRNFGI